MAVLDNAFDLQMIIYLEKQFLIFFLRGCLRQVLLYKDVRSREVVGDGYDEEFGVEHGAH